jgi:two-component system OmpR family response regulator
MKLLPHIVMFMPGTETSPGLDAEQRAADLSSYGLQVLRLATPAALFADVHRVTLSGNPVIVILAAAHSDNCAAASYLNAMHPSVGLAAMTDSPYDTQGIELMQSGVDSLCLHTASASYMVALLCRLLARVGRQEVVAAASPPSRSPSWRLQDQGWVLVSPNDIRITLTTRERAFLTTLMGMPDLSATHEQLNMAIRIGHSAANAETRETRLGVLVSRLRRKLAKHQLETPLKSIHSWGYMFTGQTQQPDPRRGDPVI